MQTFNVVDNPDGYETQIQATSIEDAVEIFKSIALDNPQSYNIGEDGISDTITIFVSQADDEDNRTTAEITFNT